MIPSVRVLAIVLIFLTACGSKQPGTTGAGVAAHATVFPAARWVPANPTYVISAHSFLDAQVAFTDFIDVLGTMLGRETSEAAQELTRVLGVDPMSAQAVAGIGVDLEGSLVVFSEDLNPTFVVHLDAPDAMAAFFERQREKGLRTQSVVIAGAEVFTAKVDGDLWISWAVDADWLWVHFALDKPDGTAWFENSKQKGGSAWVDGWTWARALAPQAEGVVGLVDLQRVIAAASKGVESRAACVRDLASVRRVGLNVETDGKQLGARLALDVGAVAPRIGATVMPPPPGWDAAATNAPIAAQMNVDLAAAAAWAQGCFGDVEGLNLAAQLEPYGVRTARAFLHALDPDDKEGTGAVAFDLSNATFFRGLLDEVPRRSMFESSKTFGIYKGKHISVPFVAKADYVLDDTIGIASMGDGLLAKIGTGAPAGPPPLVSLDLRPPGLSAGVWTWILTQLDAPEPERFAQRLLTWQNIHLGARLDGSSLVIEAAGNRR